MFLDCGQGGVSPVLLIVEDSRPDVWNNQPVSDERKNIAQRLVS